MTLAVQSGRFDLLRGRVNRSVNGFRDRGNRVHKGASILGLIAMLCLGGCEGDEASRSSQQRRGEKAIFTVSASPEIQNPFPGAKEVRLFVEKGYGPNGTPILSRPEGRLLSASELADFEGALRIEKAPEAMAACFIPHHFFRYYDERGRQIGEINICFCCSGVEASKGAKISVGPDQILAADYKKLEALVLRLGEPTDVLCD